MTTAPRESPLEVAAHTCPALRLPRGARGRDPRCDNASRMRSMLLRASPSTKSPTIPATAAECSVRTNATFATDPIVAARRPAPACSRGHRARHTGRARSAPSGEGRDARRCPTRRPRREAKPPYTSAREPSLSPRGFEGLRRVGPRWSCQPLSGTSTRGSADRDGSPRLTDSSMCLPHRDVNGNARSA